MMNPDPGYPNWRLIVSVTLLLAAFLGLQVLSHGMPVLPRKSLEQFPHQLGPWKGTDVPIEDGVQAVLGATDLLNRVYRDPQTQSGIGLFVAFFESQRRGGAIHSPKNCLPGSGWSALESGTTTLTVAGSPTPVELNRYIIQKDLNRQVVLYWYQSQGRIIASEYSAKAYLIWDALTKNRSDGALVRVVTPVVNGDEGAAVERAKSFVQRIFRPLENHLPG